jgi:WD40 repeat protein
MGGVVADNSGTRKRHKKRRTVALAALIVALILIAYLVAPGWYSTNRGALIRSVPIHHRFDSATLNPTAKLLATGTMVEPLNSPNPYEISLFNTDTGQALGTWRTQNGLDLALSSDGRLLALRSEKAVLLAKPLDGSSVRRLPTNEETFQMSFNRDDQILAVAGEATLSLWRVQDGTLLRSLDIKDCESYSLGFSWDSEMLGVGCGDYNHAEQPAQVSYSILLWDLRSGTLLRELSGHVSEVSALAFSPDGTLLASGGGDGVFREWVVRDGGLRNEQKIKTGVWQQVQGHQSVYSVAFSPDGELIAYAGSDNQIHVVESRNGVVVDILKVDGGPILKLGFETNDKLLSLSQNGNIQLWAIKSRGRR